MEISKESRKRMSQNADTNTPSIVVLYFRPKVAIVVHRKRAIEMFSKFPVGTKTNSGFRRQSMLLISYAWVPRKCHRKQLVYLERMDHRRRINEVQILRKCLFLDGWKIRNRGICIWLSGHGTDPKKTETLKETSQNNDASEMKNESIVFDNAHFM